MFKDIMLILLLVLLVALGGGTGCLHDYRTWEIIANPHEAGSAPVDEHWDLYEEEHWPKRDQPRPYWDYGSGKMPTSKSTKTLDTLTGGDPKDRGGGGGGGGGHCFAAGTQVLMADGALQDIAALETGDQLLSRDPATGEFRPVAVEKVYQADQPELFLINGTLRVTGTHPFMLEQGATRSAAELRPGDVVQGKDATVTIQSIERIEANQEVFNLTVSDTHTFFVSGGDTDIYWVHNK